jgi:ABC-2 type transport system permease protein
MLMTAPVTDTQVVLAKYFGALVFFILMWLPTIAYVFILKRFMPQAPLDVGPMFSAYAGAFLVGAFYIAVGLLTSALSKDQVVAAMACFAVIAISFFSGFIPYYTKNQFFFKLSSYVSSVEHMIEFSRGMVDTRAVVLYLSLCAVILFAAVKVVESRKSK